MRRAWRALEASRPAAEASLYAIYRLWRLTQSDDDDDDGGGDGGESSAAPTRRSSLVGVRHTLRDDAHATSIVDPGRRPSFTVSEDGEPAGVLADGRAHEWGWLVSKSPLAPVAGRWRRSLAPVVGKF